MTAKKGPSDEDLRSAPRALSVDVRVPGPACTGHLVGASAATRTSEVLLVGELEFKHYQSVVRSRGVVCEYCGPTSHIAVVCRILGIPVVVAAGVRRLFAAGDEVTIDVAHERIYVGSVQTTGTEVPVVAAPKLPSKRFRYQLSIIAEPGLIERTNAIGRADIEQYFLREELIWVALQRDPFAYLADTGANGVTDLLVDALAPLAAELERGQRLNYRALDIRSDQRHHFGTTLPHEANPQLGLHGVRQLLRAPCYLEAELRAVDQLYARGITNVVYSLPFLAVEEELIEVLRLRDAVCEHEIAIGVFAETPAAILELPYLLAHQLTSVYVGTKDLTQLVLAADRENMGVSHLLNANARPVLASVGAAVKACGEAKVPVFVFAFVENLEVMGELFPTLARVSIPAADYLHAT